MGFMSVKLCLIILVIPCLISGDSAGDDSFEEPQRIEIGYKGQQTPNCVDGTIYATSRSACRYPRHAIEKWIRQNPERMEDLYRNVPVQVRQPKQGNFPNRVNGVESCNYVEDYPELRWVYSFDDGWLPVVQTDRYKQFYRLEYCTSPKCSQTLGGKCQTFESRVQVLAWNGQEVVGTTVLLQTSCKCMLDQGDNGNSVGGANPLPLPATCNPYTDCSCRCPPMDDNCFIHRRLTCAGDVADPRLDQLVPGDDTNPWFFPEARIGGFPWRHHRWRRHHRSGSRSRSSSRPVSRSVEISGEYDPWRWRHRFPWFWRRWFHRRWRHRGSRSGSRSHSRSSSRDRSRSRDRSWSGDRSRSGSYERYRHCDPYTDCSCPCKNWRTRRHCLDYRARNNICNPEQNEGYNLFPYEPADVFEGVGDLLTKK